MLTRELLRFDQRHGKITPRFVDVKSALLADLARDLILLYTSGEGQSREELSEAAMPRINGFRSPLIAKGINKLLQDRCTFRESLEGMEERRLATFAAAARHLRAADMDDLEGFRNAVAQDMTCPDPDQLALELHADLPDRQPLTAFDPVEPEALLERYNLAQAQGPLFWAERLTLHIAEPDPGQQRRFFQLMKWFQLLARVKHDPEKSDGFTLELDGPLSLFDVQRKYGLKLAAFLPAICQLSRWRLTARTRMESQSATLELNDSMGLKSHFSRKSQYIPEELTIFAEKFAQEVTNWTILPHPELLELGGQELVVPDFTFRHQSKKVIHLELFHRWHASQLPRRLQRLDALTRPPPLLIGIDRALTRQTELIPLLENSPWFQAHGFPFNQFPPVKRVLGALEGFAEGDG
ncbi:MAG: DUF790 family protein [Magnetococcales bacterium]|nr:DUF790 family protein [Magnetococcales bacterium]